MREANRLLSASRCCTRAKVSWSTMAGTAISVRSSRGRSTVLTGRVVALAERLAASARGG